MTTQLIEEFTEWLAGSGATDSASLAGDAETFLQWRGSAPLKTLDDNAIRTFLLDWCPRQVTMPADRSREMCDAVAEFVNFLGCTGRLNGGAQRGRGLMRTAAGLADTMQTRMSDPSNWGMAKSLFAGIDGAESMTESELSAAVQRRVEEYNALPQDQREALTDRFFDPTTQAFELPFLHIPPPQEEVAAAVAKATLPAQVQALIDYLGEAGKLLTAKGNLKLADGRALVALLDTGDEIDPKYGDTTFKTQSTETLGKLMYILAVAEESGAVRHLNKRLVPVKAWSRKSAIDRAAKLFDTVIDFGVLSMMGTPMPFYDDLHALLDGGVVHWLAGLIAAGTRADFDDIVELNEHVVLERFDEEQTRYYLSFGHLAKDVARILQTLDATGVIEWSDREESYDKWGQQVWAGGMISMTAFGRHVLPRHLPAAGMVLRTAEDLADAELLDLIDLMDTQPPEQHSAILTAWRPSLPRSERAGLVAALISDAGDPRTRLVGLRLLGMFEIDVAEPHMRQLLDTPAAGHAAMWLLDHGLAEPDTVGGFITPAVLVDILSLLVDNPEVLCEQFLAAPDPEAMLEFFWRHPAPETAAVLDTLGRHLPDRTLAKQARKAAMRHRSWTANQARP